MIFFLLLTYVCFIILPRTNTTLGYFFYRSLSFGFLMWKSHVAFVTVHIIVTWYTWFNGNRKFTFNKNSDVSVLLYFSGPSRSLMPALLSVEHWQLSTAQTGAMWREGCCTHYSSYIDSIKPSMQFSRTFIVINASSEGSLCFQIIYTMVIDYVYYYN
jgi:hypothetical protein